jgi:hypothetical protein
MGFKVVYRITYRIVVASSCVYLGAQEVHVTKDKHSHSVYDLVTDFAILARFLTQSEMTQFEMASALFSARNVCWQQWIVDASL